MATIMELRTKRANLWEGAKAFLDSHRGNDGKLSAEDAAAYDKMEADVVALGKEIERMERQAAIDAELAKPTAEPIVNAPTAPVPEKVGRASNASTEDFARHLRGKHPIHNVLSEGSDADGGYLVPEEFERQIVTTLDEANIIRSLAKVITTGSERKIPVASTHSVAQWTPENGSYQESNPTFGQKQIDAYKLTDLIRVSQELLQDSAFDLENYIAGEFARAFGIAEEQAFCVGTGDGQPTGIFTDKGGNVGVTAAANNAITVDELIALVYALKSPYRRNAKFLMNDATVSLLRKLKDGNGAYLWQPSVQAGQPDRLLGYEIYTSPYVPMVSADAFTVAFGDFNNYWIADRTGRTVQRLNELYATNGQIGYVATERVDGKVILSEGIQLLKMKG